MTIKKGDPKPHATIEGSAEDVTPASSKPARKTTGATRAAVNTAAKAKTLAKETATGDEAKSDTAKTTKSGTQASTSKENSKPEDKSSTEKKPSSPANLDVDNSASMSPSKGSTGGGFAKVAGAGVLGGAIALGGLFIATSFDGPARNWLSNVSGARQAQEAAEAAGVLAKSQLAETLAVQDTQNASIKALAASTSQMETEVAKIEVQTAEIARLSGQLGRLTELPAQTSALAVRLSASETRLDGLTEAAHTRGETVNSLASALDEAAKAGTSSAAISTGLNRALARLETLEPQVAALKSEISTLLSDRTEQDQKSGQSLAEEKGWQQTTEAKIAALSAELTSLATRLQTDEQNVAKAKHAQDLKNLRQTISDGAPFAQQLAPFTKFPAAADLRELAKTGVASAKMLIDGLAELPGEDITSEASQGTIGSIIGLLGGAVRITRAGEAALQEAPMVAARNALLADEPGKAAGFIAAAKIGPEVDAWVAKAKDRAVALALVSKLTNSLAADISQPGG